MRKSGLGKGLDALLYNNDETDIQDQDSIDETEIIKKTASSAGSHSQKSRTGPPSLQAAAMQASPQLTVQLPIEKLVPGSGQPRKNFNETEMKELAQSIKEYGIIQPVIAADTGDGSYMIIAGERRTRAAKLAGLKTVPVIIRDYTDQKRLEISLVENIQRSDLNPIEEAAAYKNLMDFSNLSQDELSVRVGKNRSTIANALRLLKLPAEIQKSLEQGSISPGHARALLSVSNVKIREKLYRDILAKELSVRETEKLAASLTNEKPDSKKKSAAASGKRPPEIDAMVEKFIGKLGTKVVIEGDMNKGRIYIDYYSMEDLERLYEVLGG